MPTARAYSCSAPPATPGPPMWRIRRARAWCSPSARSPNTAASPATPTRALGWTSSRPAVASALSWAAAAAPVSQPLDPPGADIMQMTYLGSSRSRFGFPSGYSGTSMATPHVAAAAALVLASGVLGPKPTPAAIGRRLERTARDLGPAGRDDHYGSGLIDAGAATDPGIPAT